MDARLHLKIWRKSAEPLHTSVISVALENFSGLRVHGIQTSFPWKSYSNSNPKLILTPSNNDAMDFLHFAATVTKS